MRGPEFQEGKRVVTSPCEFLAAADAGEAVQFEIQGRWLQSDAPPGGISHPRPLLEKLCEQERSGVDVASATEGES